MADTTTHTLGTYSKNGFDWDIVVNETSRNNNVYNLTLSIQFIDVVRDLTSDFYVEWYIDGVKKSSSSYEGDSGSVVLSSTINNVTATNHIISVQAALSIDGVPGTDFTGLISTNGGTVYLSGYDDGSGDKEDESSITLNANGGIFKSTETETLTMSIPGIGDYVEVPYRDGYTFLGFSAYQYDEKLYTDERGCVSVGGIVEGDTLYAFWQEDTSVKDGITLSGNGGQFNDGFSISYDDLQVGQQVEIPRWEPREFLGFNGAQDGTDKYYIDERGVVQDVTFKEYTDTLYAQWSAESYMLTLTLYAEGGIFESNGTDVLEITYPEETDPDTVEIPIRENYIFKGYEYHSILYIDEQGNDITDTSIYKDGITHLFAVWESSGSWITLNATGGTFASNGSDSLIYSNLTSGDYVEVPVKDGYTFIGFSVYEDDVKCYIDENGYVMASDIMDYDTVYAVWEQTTPTNPWEEIDENAPACQVYVDNTGTLYARNFRVHSENTIIIDSLGDVYAKSFTFGDIIGMSAEGLIMKNFKPIREEGYNIKTIVDANNNIIVDNNNNIIVAICNMEPTVDEKINVVVDKNNNIVVDNNNNIAVAAY